VGFVRLVELDVEVVELRGEELPRVLDRLVVDRRAELLDEEVEDARGVDPLFPFGFGLSYTRFALGEATVRVEEGAGEAGDVRVHVALDVTNAGKRAGQEVVQLYVADPASSVARPPCELRAFAKVSLAPGERKRIEWTLGSEAFAFWDPIGRTWTAEAGDYELRIGRSSRDLPVRARLALAHDHKRGPDRPLEG